MVVVSLILKNEGFRVFGKEKGENDTRMRSTAGYWMGENRSQLKPTLKKYFV